MKCENILISLSILVLISLSSCEQYLDLAPELDLSEADIYETYYTATQYLDNCYVALYDYQGATAGGLGQHQFEYFSDNACTTPATSNTAFCAGDWFNRKGMAEVGWGDNNMGNSSGFPLSNGSFCIRIANNVIENAGKISKNGATQQQKDWLLGQAYFFRAWYYFEWIRRFGGMPPVNKLYTSSDDLDIERQPYKKCSEDIIADLDEAIALLPHKWNDENQGRAEKASAYALKGMVALYAASPLMQNSMDQVVERDDYDLEWAKRAAIYSSATLKYLDENRPEKNMIDPAGKTQAELDSLWRNVQYHENYMSPEALWCKNHAAQCNIGGNTADRQSDLTQIYWNVRVSGRGGGWGKNITVPSQNLVDAFEMADGSKFDWNNTEHATNPYKNRDPRLYSTIVFPGEQWSKVGMPSAGSNIFTNPQPAENDLFYLETWVTQDGLLGIDISHNNPEMDNPSGYMVKKWWWYDAYDKIDENPGGYGKYKFNSEFIRTTQVWLDLAEALYEVAGANGSFDGYNGPTAMEAVNKVRAKAGMPPLTIGGEEFKERVRNERRVELAFEYHRWWDLRRWMLFDEVFAEKYPIKGIKPTVISTNNTTNQEEWSYTYEVVDIKSAVRNFTTKHYWYPIPKDHTDQLFNSKQNPGW